jgi:ribonuclease D
MTVYFHEEDLPEGVLAPGPVAVDTETMGLITQRDRLCVVQISDGQGGAGRSRAAQTVPFRALRPGGD